MSSHLQHLITPEIAVEAKEAGIRSVESYPAGVTTNSSYGSVDYDSYYPVLEDISVYMSMCACGAVRSVHEIAWRYQLISGDVVILPDSLESTIDLL